MPQRSTLRCRIGLDWSGRFSLPCTSDPAGISYSGSSRDPRSTSWVSFDEDGIVAYHRRPIVSACAGPPRGRLGLPALLQASRNIDLRPGGEPDHPRISYGRSQHVTCGPAPVNILSAGKRAGPLGRWAAGAHVLGNFGEYARHSEGAKTHGLFCRERTMRFPRSILISWAPNSMEADGGGPIDRAEWSLACVAWLGQPPSRVLRIHSLRTTEVDRHSNK